MEKVLVTGGCGFIGSHVVTKLKENGYDVAVVDNLISGKLENIIDENIHFFNCDISSHDFEMVVANYRPHYIIHQAAQPSVPKSMDDLKYDQKVNILGSLNVIEAARKYHVKKIVYASTSAIYGDPHYLPIDVKHPISPLSPYGISKYSAEMYLKLAKQIYGIDYTILRYSNVFGPKQNHQSEGGVVAIFANCFINGIRPTIYGDGEQTRDFIYVEDVANANVIALHEGNGDTLHISTGTQITVNRIFELMKKIMNVDLSPVYQPARQGDIKYSVLCNHYTRERINWSPTISLEQGLVKTLEYYQQEGRS